MKIYLAAPFFNKEQKEREERVKNKLRKLGFDVYSPLENGIVNNNNTQKIFNDNLWNIRNCDYVFCITDTKDIGSIWEAGYAYGQNIRIIYYCETLGVDCFNVMLAKSAFAVLLSFEEIDNLKEMVVKGEGNKYEGNIE